MKKLLLALCLTILSGIGTFAQNDNEENKTINFSVLIYGVQEKMQGGGMRSVSAPGVAVHLYLANGQSANAVTDNDGMALFRRLPVGSEYILEFSIKGYTSAIYHRTVPAKQGFPADFHASNIVSSDKQSFFEDPGPADVEGFVVRPAPHPFITAPLSGAVVLYTSDEDSIYTTTDQHGYFRFDAVNNKNGKISVSHENYKASEAVVPAEDGSRWLWVLTEGNVIINK